MAVTEHVAILKRAYVRLILAGRKTMESRFTRTARAPYKRIHCGDRIYFKVSSGPYMAVARAGKVRFYDGLDRSKVVGLFHKWNDRIIADESYMEDKRDSRYASLIELRDVKATSTGPVMAASRGIAWFVLKQRKGLGKSTPRTQTNVAVVIALTNGAIRNGYVRVGTIPTLINPENGLTLVLPDGRPVETTVTSSGMIRWRGWKCYYREHAVRVGDGVRFERIGAARFAVRFIQGHERDERHERNDATT